MKVSKMASPDHPFPETPAGEKQHSSGGLATGLQGNNPPPPPPSACQEKGINASVTRGHSRSKFWCSCGLTISGKHPKVAHGAGK